MPGPSLYSKRSTSQCPEASGTLRSFGGNLSFDPVLARPYGMLVLGSSSCRSDTRIRFRGMIS